MQTTEILEQMASVISTYHLHTGENFAIRTHNDQRTQYDICALAWIIAEDRPAPSEFFTDEVGSLAIIEASASAMTAIKAISDVLDSSVCETEVVPGMWVPDYVEHVSNWAATAPIGASEPPTPSQVMGYVLRAACTVRSQTPTVSAA